MRILTLLAVGSALVCSSLQAEQINIAILEFSSQVDPSLLGGGLEGVDLARSHSGEPVAGTKNDDLRNGKVSFLYQGPLQKGGSASTTTELEQSSAKVSYSVQGDQAEVEVALSESSPAPLRKTRRSVISGSGSVGSTAMVLAARQSSARIVSSDRAQRTKITNKGSTLILVVQISQ